MRPPSIAKIKDLKELEEMLESTEAFVNKYKTQAREAQKVLRLWLPHLTRLRDKVGRLKQKDLLNVGEWYEQEWADYYPNPKEPKIYYTYILIERITQAGNVHTLEISDLKLEGKKLTECIVTRCFYSSRVISAETFTNNIKLLIQSGMNLGPQLNEIREAVSEHASLLQEARSLRATRESVGDWVIKKGKSYNEY